MTETFCITEILEKYKSNMDRQRELDESLLQDREKSEWIACLQNRAVENQRMYMENGQLLDCLNEFLELPLQEENAQLSMRKVRYRIVERVTSIMMRITTIKLLAIRVSISVEWSPCIERESGELIII